MRQTWTSFDLPTAHKYEWCQFILFALCCTSRSYMYRHVAFHWWPCPLYCPTLKPLPLCDKPVSGDAECTETNARPCDLQTSGLILAPVLWHTFEWWSEGGQMERFCPESFRPSASMLTTLSKSRRYPAQQDFSLLANNRLTQQRLIKNPQVLSVGAAPILEFFGFLPKMRLLHSFPWPHALTWVVQ